MRSRIVCILVKMGACTRMHWYDYLLKCKFTLVFGVVAVS